MNSDNLAAQAQRIRDTRPHLASVVELRMVPVPTVPDAARWTRNEQAQAARVLSIDLATQCSEYGAAVVLEALALALRTDMHQAAELMHRARLAASYDAAAVMLRGMADELDRVERSEQ